MTSYRIIMDNWFTLVNYNTAWPAGIYNVRTLFCHPAKAGIYSIISIN
jgi:hypothetical protein